jgi:hypothetical protein
VWLSLLQALGLHEVRQGISKCLDRPSDLERHPVKWCDDVNFKGNLRGKEKKTATKMEKPKHERFYYFSE